jgi:hypothetical protein
LEPLKEAVEAWLHRVRAPILGYTLLAGLVINWKPLWALLFADIDVFSKFLYFDLRTDYWTLIVLPLLVGVLSALMTPWIALAGEASHDPLGDYDPFAHSSERDSPWRRRPPLESSATFRTLLRRLLTGRPSSAVWSPLPFLRASV